MRRSRWILAGLGATLAVGLLGCSEGDKLTLAEMERLKRDVDKQMRLVKEQNLQINDKQNVLKEELRVIKEEYIPAVMVSLDSVSAKPDQVKVQMIAEVENRLRTITENVKDFKKEVNDDIVAHKSTVADSLKSRLDGYNKRISYIEDYTQFVLTQQDSVNREFANRIDKRPWYVSIIGAWDDRQREKRSNP